MPVSENIPVVVFANRKDFFLTKLAVASIRYFYPDIEIFIVKDKLNGDFSCRRLCAAFNVKILKLQKKYFGWSAAKIHFLLESNSSGRRYLCIDSDIVFVGRVLDNISCKKGAFVLEAEARVPPFSQEVISLYVDPEKVKKFYPDYEYPGYFFNAGQTVVTPGLLTSVLLENCFDAKRYPYYKNRDVFSLVDQAVLNAVLPVLSKRQKVDIGTLHFMKWSVSFFKEDENSLFDKFKDGGIPFLVHYAGDTRTRHIENMKGKDILVVFRKHYYDRLSTISLWQDRWQDKICSWNFLTKLLLKRNRLFIELANRLNRPHWY